MAKMSHNKVVAICDICKVENEISFVKYNLNFDRGGFYSCKKCSGIKRKKTTFDKYGVEFITQLPELKEKLSEWMSSDEFKSKSINTQLDKYGCLFTKTDDFKLDTSERSKRIIEEKKSKGIYNCALSKLENNELKKQGMINKYGSEYSFLVPEIKDKIQKNNLQKFGHISPFGNNEIQNKIKENLMYKNLEKEWSFNGDMYKVNQFKIYRRKVRYETDMIKKCLYEKWDGYDYYDGEYIKEYLSLHKNHNYYPSIDHKISCFYGFINDLPTTDISDINNLCITKRIINSKKSHLNEEDFILILENGKITN